MKNLLLFSISLLAGDLVRAQLKWINVDSLYSPLPSSVHVYRTNDSLDGKPNIAYYVVADLKNKRLEFTADTSRDRRLTPQKFYERNNHPLIVVNTAFFSYETNRSINTIIKDGKLVAYNLSLVKGRGADSVNMLQPFRSAIGISKKRKPDVAWIYTDSLANTIQASQKAIKPKYPLIVCCDLPEWKVDKYIRQDKKWYQKNFDRWTMTTAVGGGPVLLQEGLVKITNEEEMMFTGKAILDKHPRTTMGYTRDNKLIILVIQGRFPGIAEGATLLQEAEILKKLGCWEALNLDGGGSSCMLINGRETVKPSDKEGQRPVPAVFIITGQ